MEILLTAAALPVATSLDASPAPESTRPESAPPTPRVSAGPDAGWLNEFDWHDLIEPEFWQDVPPDVPELLRLLALSDVYVQDEIDIRLHPTLARVWSRRGSRGQREVRAPGRSFKFVGFGAVEWREGWVSVGYGDHRSAEIFCQQLDHLVEHSSSRNRRALVILDNLKIHTEAGSKLLRETLEKHGDKLRLVYTPPYDPEANPTERLWPHFRLAVTHNHHRDTLPELYYDTVAYFEELDTKPDTVLSHIGSPFAAKPATDEATKEATNETLA